MDASDIWGWMDPASHREFAIMGCMSGTTFVDVTDPLNPGVLGYLYGSSPTPTFWRDIKVYQDYAFIGSESEGHGLQVYDLHHLLNLTPIGPHDPMRQLAATAHYGQFGSSHNININEDTGFLYAVGSKTCGGGGLHIVDIRDPTHPQFAGCFSEDGYTHDAQCVVYDGPDRLHAGKEICFCYNEDTLTIVDVTNKSNLVMLSRTEYESSQYTHQGWLSADQSHLLMDDEWDEIESSGTDGHTRTLIWNVERLEAPVWVNSFFSAARSIDHNQYTHQGRAYQSNYCSGLRVVNVTQLPTVTAVGFFDLAPDCDALDWLGTWSNYPFFPSGNLIVSSIERGLFVLRLHAN
jgi:choice-of-anchor B domain-containing protein